MLVLIYLPWQPKRNLHSTVPDCIEYLTIQCSGSTVVTVPKINSLRTTIVPRATSTHAFALHTTLLILPVFHTSLCSIAVCFRSPPKLHHAAQDVRCQRNGVSPVSLIRLPFLGRWWQDPQRTQAARRSLGSDLSVQVWWCIQGSKEEIDGNSDAKR
jgi:hypothetical protein